MRVESVVVALLSVADEEVQCQGLHSRQPKVGRHTDSFEEVQGPASYQGMRAKLVHSWEEPDQARSTQHVHRP